MKRLGRGAVKPMMSRYVSRLFVLAAVVAAATAQARVIELPLTFDYEFIRQALLNQIYTSPSGKAVLWDDGTGCGFLKLREPQMNASGTRIRILTRGEARVGTPMGDQCLAPLQWEGFLEIFEEPHLSAEQHQLEFRVVESNIYDTEMKKRFLSGRVWDLVKKYAQPRFETVRIDLDAPIASVRELLPLVVAHDDAARLQTMLDSLHLVTATASAAGVAATLAFEAADVTPAVGPTPEPTLTAEELRRWETAWQQWDAFLTFVIKHFSLESKTSELRLALADVLIDARFDILEALAPSTPGTPDPTRALFLQTWQRLAPLVKQAAAAQPSAVALQYLTFIAAGDALSALDQLGPDAGIEISADGLRRLARAAAPQSTEDPLLYTSAVDPDLRQALGFGAPLPLPDLSGAPSDETWWHRLLAPPSAFAADQQPPEKALARWLPDTGDIGAYLHTVREVLDAVTKKTLAEGELAASYQDVYRRLVLAAAWQESCWRQFIRANGKVTYLKSAVGSTGMMQVNEHVWRGVYDLRGLRWDIGYNGSAGGEILLHYLQNYAVAQHEDRGGIDNVARATYAVYNGGPGQLTRYRSKHPKPSLKRIDDLFLQKYDAVKAGHEMDVARCIVGG